MNIYFEQSGYRIRRRDSVCLVLEELMPNKTAAQKKRNAKCWRNRGYYSTLSAAVRSFCDQYATYTEATSVKELTEALRALEETIMETAKGGMS